MTIERLNDLLILRDQHHTYVIVPAEDVLLTEIVMPKLSRQRLLQALPFALEEKLITDLSELHFAVADYKDDGTVPVAVVNKTKMQSWLAILNDASIFPTTMIPMQLALPYRPNEWSMCVDDHGFVVRTGDYSGFFCDSGNKNTVFAELNPEKVNSHDLSEEITIEKPYINLLQPPFHRQQHKNASKKIGLYSVYALCSALVFMMAGYLVSWAMLRHAVNESHAQISEIYKRHFPNAKALVAPKERMESKLRKLTSPSQNDFLYLLALSSETLTKSPSVKVQRMDYHNHVLMMTILAPTFEKLDVLVRLLKAKGLQVKSENATNIGLDVTAEIQISWGAV